MSFSAWFSALGRPFFLPSVLSLVAFPANRHGAHHPLPQPQAALPGVQIPLGKGIAASPRLGAQPGTCRHLYGLCPASPVFWLFFFDPSPFIRRSKAEQLQHSWGLLWKTTLPLGSEESLP